MTRQPHDGDGPDTGEIVTYAELTQVCRISAAELDELVEYGALVPVATRPEQRVFHRTCVTTVRVACKLRRDYDLDLFTVALLVEHLSRIEQLESEVRLLRSQLPSHLIAKNSAK